MIQDQAFEASEDQLGDERALEGLLKSVAMAANEADTVDGAVTAVLERICALTRWSVGEVHVLDGEDFRVVRQCDRRRGAPAISGESCPPVTAGEALVRRVAAGGTLEWVEDLATEPGNPTVWSGGGKLSSAVAVPVSGMGSVVAVLALYSEEPREPDPDFLLSLTLVGTQLGQAIVRARTAEALRLSEAKYSGIVSLAADAIISVGRDHRILVYNEGAEAIFGHPASQMIGRDLGELIPERFREVHDRHIEAFIASDAVARQMGRRQEIYGLRRDGEEFPAEASISKVEVAGRTILTVILRDLTDRRRVEAELREREEMFRQLTENIDEVFWVRDAVDGGRRFDRFAYVSPAWSTITGQSPAELYEDPDSVLGIVHPDDREQVEALLSAALERCLSVEFRVVRPDGGVRWLASRTTPLRDPDGRTYRVVGVTSDVTERVEAEAARERVAGSHRFLADASRILSSSLDWEETLRGVAHLAVTSLADWCVVYLSRGRELRRLEVAHRDPARGELAERLRRAPLDPALPYPVRTVLESGISELANDVTSEGSSPSGDEAYWRLLADLDARSFMAVPLTVRGSTLGVLAFISTDPARAYGPDDLWLAEELARRAALAIDNARLYGESQRSSRLRDEVLNLVSHDLGNAVASIDMGARHLLSSAPDPDRRVRTQAYLERIVRAAEQMGRLLHDLVDVGKMEAGHFSIDPAREPVESLLREAMDHSTHLADARSLELRADIDVPSDLRVSVDRHRILQLLSNLIGNAIRYTEPGGHIRVAARLEPEHLCVLVEDDGPGIPEENQEKIFDRFTQARRSKRAGAGLGLAISREIVQAHGGRIWVESEEGSGSRFYFTLPLEDAAGSESPAPPVP